MREGQLVEFGWVESARWSRIDRAWHAVRDGEEINGAKEATDVRDIAF
jgi:hypothetical protein